MNCKTQSRFWLVLAGLSAGYFLGKLRYKGKEKIAADTIFTL